MLLIKEEKMKRAQNKNRIPIIIKNIQNSKLKPEIAHLFKNLEIDFLFFNGKLLLFYCVELNEMQLQ